MKTSETSSCELQESVHQRRKCASEDFGIRQLAPSCIDLRQTEALRYCLPSFLLLGQQEEARNYSGKAAGG
ncbi:hypothetical protein R1flu_014615 [Riccia fluitans]|uniref:Uncharacterized protein n=1 Tax=Riccia fluitans TaxID=41844 RepID=A0ABD1YGL2_9MARC